MRALCRRPTNGKEDVMKVHSKIARMAVASMAAAVVAAPTAGAMPMQGDAAERDMHASTVVQADRGAGDRRGEASIPALRPQTGGQVTTADLRTEAAKGPSTSPAPPAGLPTWPVDPKPIVPAPAAPVAATDGDGGTIEWPTALLIAAGALAVAGGLAAMVHQQRAAQSRLAR